MRKDSVDINMYGARNAAKIAAAMGHAAPAESTRKVVIDRERLTPRRGHETGRMNKTEAAYAALLDVRVAAREIRWYAFEAIKFRLADRCWYTPDFFVVMADMTIELHETKGHMEDDAAVKLRVVREMFQHVGLVIVRNEGGTWKYERR